MPHKVLEERGQLCLYDAIHVGFKAFRDFLATVKNASIVQAGFGVLQSPSENPKGRCPILFADPPRPQTPRDAVLAGLPPAPSPAGTPSIKPRHMAKLYA